MELLKIILMQKSSFYFLLLSSSSSSSSWQAKEQQFPFKVVVGVSCGGLFILALITIFLVRRCQRRKKAKQRRYLDGMPGDVAFSRAEKYELEDQKEDIVRYEEVAISAIGVRYEGLGVTNEAARYEEVGVSNGAGQSEEIGISNDAVRYDEIGILNKAMQ